MMRLCLAAAACAAVLASGAHAAAAKKRPLNWRMRKVPAASTAPAPVAEPAARPPSRRSDSPRLMAGRWTPEVRAALQALIDDKGRGAEGYDPKNPPVAVLPWSDAAVAGDPAELVFLRMVSDARFKATDEWWEIVPIIYGRQPARAAYESFVSLSSSVWTSQPGYHAWRKGMLSSYLQICRQVGRRECRSYLAKLWAGWRDVDAEDFARLALDEEKQRVGASESVPGAFDDARPLRARRGLRVVPEMRDLVSKLRSAGFDVWIVDDVPQPVLSASAQDYGVDSSRIYGIRNSTEGAHFGPDVAAPVPTRGGKTEIIQSTLGRPADLAIGRDAADFDLLSYGEGLRVVLDADPELSKKARERGWLVQRAFAR